MADETTPAHFLTPPSAHIHPTHFGTHDTWWYLTVTIETIPAQFLTPLCAYIQPTHFEAHDTWWYLADHDNLSKRADFEILRYHSKNLIFASKLPCLMDAQNWNVWFWWWCERIQLCIKRFSASISSALAVVIEATEWAAMSFAAIQNFDVGILTSRHYRPHVSYLQFWLSWLDLLGTKQGDPQI